ncbi:MAG: hypothetical protein EOO04_23965 [Chitinophagaceae bacterium]|nr:MAG: hypothetical protein EOO04_23965 [Chitinophagaceae bacterium]
MRYTDIQNIANKQNDWLKSLDFYKEDLDILTNRLNEVSAKNTGKDMLASVDHFESRFDIQRQNISNLQHRVKATIHSCATDIQQHAGKVNERLVQDSKKNEEDLSFFETDIKFLALW